MEDKTLYSVPLYVQISELISKKIEEGFYLKNQLLPSEMEIQKEYGVSRITARNAYKVLADKGIVRTVRGKGTYVNDINEKDWTWMEHFTSEVRNSGHIPSTKIHKFKKVKAVGNIAKILEIDKNAEVYTLCRIRYIDNMPVWLTYSYVVSEKAEGLEKDYFSYKGVSQSLFYVLEKDFGMNFSTDTEAEFVLDITEADLNLMEIDKSKSFLKKAHLVRNMAGIPVVFEQTIFKQKITKSGDKNSI